MADPRIQKLLAQAGDLMPLSSSISRAIQVMNDPKSSASDLAEILTFDLALAAKLLRVANSAYYGFDRKVSTVSEAIVRLGFTTVKRLIFSAHVSGFMNNRIESYGLEKGDLWRHSIGGGMGAMMLAQKDRTISMGEAYVAGLLHDVGKAFLDQYLAKEFKEVAKRVIEEETPYHIIEREVFGFDHAEVGALIAQKWNLPSQMVEGIAYHHRPTLAKQAQKVASMVHVADCLCHSLGVGVGAINFQNIPVEYEAIKLLGLQESDFAGLKVNLESSMEFADLFLDDPVNAK